MSNLKANQPIGIFDSGIGGLTVAKAVVDKLPNESIIYFGDTQHLPYGDKSARVVQDCTKKVVDFLLSRDVKMILIACNSASAAAYEMLKEYIGDRALLVNVIDPVVGFVAKNYLDRSVGLIGTKLTVQSQTYQEKTSDLTSEIDFRALATPVLGPIIEEGFLNPDLIEIVLNEYLKNPTLQNIDALILGCTHYPLIKNNIEDFYKGRVDVLDAAKIVAAEVENILSSQDLLADKPATHDFYVSDYTESFAKGARRFFGDEIRVELLDS